MERKARILFFGSTDSCRAPMAAGILTALAPARTVATSAGITTGQLHPTAVKVLREIGHDIADHVPRALAQLEPAGFDLVVTVAAEAREVCLAPGMVGRAERKRLFGGVPVFLHWPVPDPAAATGPDPAKAGGLEPGPGAAGPPDQLFEEPGLLTVFRAARDRIRQQIEGLLHHGYLAAFMLERERLQRFADMLDDGIVIHDEYRSLFLVNDAFLRIVGRTREQVIGLDCHDVFPPLGLCGAGCRFPEKPGVVTERHAHSVEFSPPEGEPKQLVVTSEPLEIEPGKQGVLAVVRDETEVNRLRARTSEHRVFHGMVGASRAVREVFATIESVGRSDYPVLITGESGTGKELVAAAIHRESSRRDGAFVPVNCGALPENILESELFGHVRGAFTGAIRDKKGRFELADGGTLFLDEVGELSPPVQVKLLRVLQEKTFEPVGGERQIAVDVRIISATNRDLRRLVAAGSFREDLFYRLCVVPIELPPLRDRREDIPFLVEHILERIRQESGKPIARLDGRALDLVHAHTWPGNIRELINALQFASVRCTGDVVLPEHLPPEVVRPAAAGPAVGTSAESEEAFPAPLALAPRRRRKLTTAAVEEALASTGGNKVQAARLLGVGRATLYRFLARDEH